MREYLKVECQKCGNVQFVYSCATSKVDCLKCHIPLTEATGGKAHILGKVIETCLNKKQFLSRMWSLRAKEHEKISSIVLDSKSLNWENLSPDSKIAEYDKIANYEFSTAIIGMKTEEGAERYLRYMIG